MGAARTVCPLAGSLPRQSVTRDGQAIPRQPLFQVQAGDIALMYPARIDLRRVTFPNVAGRASCRAAACSPHFAGGNR